MPWVSTVYGIDFSGAAVSGKTAWLAELDVQPDARHLVLRRLRPLGALAGDDSRSAVCETLTRRILDSDAALWGMDFPFGLPIELGLGGWADQIRHVGQFAGDAKRYGQHLVELCRARVGPLHVRRRTDVQTKTPFDCYHYRIIYQTFHGIRDVLRPLSEDAATAVLPFAYRDWTGSRRTVVEACPSSTLKRRGLPHQRYKQSGGKAVQPIHRKTRQTILKSITHRDDDGQTDVRVSLSTHQRRIIMQNPGGDALDAVLAGLGSWDAMLRYDHDAVAGDDRYPLEGCVYC